MDNKKKSYQNFLFYYYYFFEIIMVQIILFTFVPPCVLTKKIISMLIKPPHSPCTFCVLLQVTVYLIQ